MERVPLCPISGFIIGRAAFLVPSRSLNVPTGLSHGCEFREKLDSVGCIIKMEESLEEARD